MKAYLIFLLILFFLFSCEDDEMVKDDIFSNYSSEICFDISEWLFQGRNISCVDFDGDGNAWLGSGSDLILYNGRDTQVFNAQSTINDLAVAPNGTVWLGTQDKGLARFKGKSFRWFNTDNSIIPRDYIHSLGVDSNNKVWFCSAQSDKGGLMNYDGRRFKLFSPGNSILNQHVIHNLRIDKNDNIYFYTYGKVGKTAVFKIKSNGKWEQLGGSNVKFYWLSSLEVTSDSKVIIYIDHSLSSCFNCYTDEILVYENGNWNTLETPFYVNFRPSTFFLDKRNYVWTIFSGPDEYFSFYVFDGSEWYRSEKGQVPDKYYKFIKTDANNNIWLCTSNGIFIMEQEYNF